MGRPARRKGGKQMLEITRLTVEHLTADCVTDCPAPHIAFAVRSDRNGAQLTDADQPVGDWSARVTGGVHY